MAEYIEREAVKNNIHCTKEGLFFCSGKTYIDFDVVSKAVLETPAAEVVEVRHGAWVHKNNEMYCSVCGDEALMDEVYYESPYCPNCGAKMDGINNTEKSLLYANIDEIIDCC